MAKLADALDLGSSGRPWGFKSLHPHHVGSTPFFLVLLVAKLYSWATAVTPFQTSFHGNPRFSLTANKFLGIGLSFFVKCFEKFCFYSIFYIR